MHYAPAIGQHCLPTYIILLGTEKYIVSLMRANLCLWPCSLSSLPKRQYFGHTKHRIQFILGPLWTGNPSTGTLANSVDPDDMLHVTFHQGLHCLIR